MQSYFKEDAYQTPENFPRDPIDRIFLNSRWWFHFKYAKVVLWYRSLVLNNQDSDEKWVEASLKIFKIVERCGGRFNLSGIDNLRHIKEPLVVISNHMSTLETQVFPCIFFPFFPITFIVKSTLATHPVFGPVMRSRRPILVGRVNPREDYINTLSQGAEKLSKGISIIVFPQSTRYVNFSPENFNSLGIKLARKARVKVLPVAIKTNLWETGRVLKDLGPIKRSKTVYMAFGKPMGIEGNGKEQHQKCIDFIQSHAEKWAKEGS